MSGMGDNYTVDSEELLWELNDEKVRLFIPVFIYIGILMFLGTAGNVMVLYFYGYKTKTSPSTCFILALAVFDLVSCVVAMPMEIADLRFYFNFKSFSACRILRLVSHFASISSGLTLVAIAIDRYRRICRPFDRQFNNRHVKVICAIIGGLSAILSWPAILFNKIVDVDVPNSSNVTLIGHDCTTTKDEDFKIYIFVTNAVYVTAFATITIVLAVLYTLIGRQLFRHQKFRHYVAKKGTKSLRATHNSPLLPVSSGNTVNKPEETMTSSDHVFEDPPDATGSVVDLKEFVTRGLTQVESDRPASGYTGITGSTGLTGMTGISGKTKRSMQSIKSVTICEPSKNQIYSIETINNHQEQGDANVSSWTEDRNRVTSPSSFATFSSRPSSAALSEYSETQTVDENDFELENEGRVVKGNEQKLTVIPENREISNILEESGGELNGREAEIRNDIENTDNIAKSPTLNRTISDSDHFIVGEGNANGQSLEEVEKTEFRVNTDIFESNHEHVLAIQNVGDLRGTIANEDELKSSNSVNRNRPSSKTSDNSRRSLISSRFRRNNTVSPESSTVTTTTSLASRASTVRRFQSFLRYNSKSSKMETDTDKVKDLRMKMLDLNTMKYTVIMLIITIIFVVSFLPYLSLVSWRYFKDDHEVNILSDFELVLFQIGVRSVFLNSSLNPIIYGGFNSTFRAFFFGLYCKCCKNKRSRQRTRKPRDQSDSTSGT